MEAAETCEYTHIHITYLALDLSCLVDFMDFECFFLNYGPPRKNFINLTNFRHFHTLFRFYYVEHSKDEWLKSVNYDFLGYIISHSKERCKRYVAKIMQFYKKESCIYEFFNA